MGTLFRRRQTSTKRRLAFALIMVSVAGSGCATAYTEGRTALTLGRYEEAATDFQRALTEQPERIDALLGLGVARYKLGAFDESVEALSQAVAKAPKSQTAQLYLGLNHLQKDDLGPAEEHLKAVLALRPEARMTEQIERALTLMRGDPLSADIRAFIATSLEHEEQWARDLQDARWAAAAYPPYRYYGLGRCLRTRRGGAVCF
jgi:tetratricopeptide (TPR) repeat protein